MPRRPSKKRQALLELFDVVKENAGSGPLVFDNKLVKQVTGESFGNQYDVTKIDTSEKLPKELRERGYFVIHLGRGRHQFVKGIDKAFHQLEEISDDESIEWKYRKSLLNESDTSEANVLALVSNQRILHDFLYEDIVASPKTYLPHRTKTSFKYYVGSEAIEVQGLQMETDYTLEYLGEVIVCEGKNGRLKDFAVYQLYHPFRYFCNLKEKGNLDIKSISGVLVNRFVRENDAFVELRKYRFEVQDRLDSVKLVKKARYKLVRR